MSPSAQRCFLCTSLSGWDGINVQHLLSLVHVHGMDWDGLGELGHDEEVAKTVLGDAVMDSLLVANGIVD